MGYDWLSPWGAVNVFGTLLVSAGFTNRTLTSLDPVVFSNFGLVAIMLWGLAYVAVSRSYQHVPYLVLVFAFESWFTRSSGPGGSGASAITYSVDRECDAENTQDDES